MCSLVVHNNEYILTSHAAPVIRSEIYGISYHDNNNIETNTLFINKKRLAISRAP